MFHGRGVEPFGQCAVVFGFVDVGVSRAVDDEFDAVCCDHSFNGFCIGDVQFADVGEHVPVGTLCSDEPQLIAQLPVGSRNEDVHVQ